MTHRSPAPALACALFAASLLAQGPATRPTGEYLDAIVAKVNRTVITKSQVDRELGPAVVRGPALDYERQFRNKLLYLVFGALEQDAVEKVGLVVPKRYVVEQLEAQKEKKGAAEVFEGIREKGYKSEEEYLEFQTKEASRNTFLAAQAGQFGNKAPQFRPDYWTEPTAGEIRRFYRQHLSDQFTQKDQAHLYAIALPYLSYNDPSIKDTSDLSTGIARVKVIAATIKEELARGTEFAVLARRYGHELRADEGGDLGWISSKEAPYQQELVDFAFNGPVKQLSEPILFPSSKAPRGIVVAWVVERATERVVPFTEAQSKIRDFLRSLRVEEARHKIVQKLLEEAYISPPDLKRDLLRAHNQQ